MNKLFSLLNDRLQPKEFEIQVVKKSNPPFCPECNRLLDKWRQTGSTKTGLREYWKHWEKCDKRPQ